jgi:hypothetical protein
MLRLAKIRSEWLAVAADLGLPLQDIGDWMCDDAAMLRLIDAFDNRNRVFSADAIDN